MNDRFDAGMASMSHRLDEGLNGVHQRLNDGRRKAEVGVGRPKTEVGFFASPGRGKAENGKLKTGSPRRRRSRPDNHHSVRESQSRMISNRS